MADHVDAGRRSFLRRRWTEAYEAFSAAPRRELAGEDLERLAVAAYLIGRDDASLEAWEAACQWHQAAGDRAEVARCSFWVAFSLMMRGQMAKASGWLSRTERSVSAIGECPAAGYLLVPGVLGALEAGDAKSAADMAAQALLIGERYDDQDLQAFGTLGHGQALIALGETAAGLSRLDEVMLSVTADEVGPITSGIVYCAVILECMHRFDLARASEWTDALSDWCDAQPDLVPYRGQCLVHRSQLQQASGQWPDAIATAELACRRLTDPPHPALGLAHYQQAELHRLVGAFDDAESEYREANRFGHMPEPGLALLQLAQGDSDAATAGIRRVLQETTDPSARLALLAAAVDIFRAVGDPAAARVAADELWESAARSPSDVLEAMAAQARGTALLAEGDPANALADLRRAAATWGRLPTPYEGARTAVLLGLACAALGDTASATLELDVARDIFVELGARPDLERLASIAAGLGAATSDDNKGPGSLTGREREVLSHVAQGKTNREIAADLVISQHTVGRHLENIFTKLGVSSRVAATAYAYEHDLL